VQYHLVTAAFLVGAVMLYAIGAMFSATVLFAFGVLAESIFWFRVFRRRKIQ